jgi:hypothetical protein
VQAWGDSGSGPGQFDRGAPSYASERLAVDARGGVYVTDYLAHSIKKFTRDGLLVARWHRESWDWTPALAADAKGDL